LKRDTPIRILIVDDHLIARMGLGAIINAQTDMTVAGEASDGRQAISRFRDCKPDVTLVDMRLPRLTGVEVVTAIRKEFPEARFVALSTYSGDEDIRRAFLAGVQAYLTKDVLHDELIRAIRAVHAGHKYPSAQADPAHQAQQPGAELSVRELEVLDLIVRGSTNKQISFALLISENTVMNHVKSIFAKLRVENRTDAATAAIRRGIVHLND